MSSLQLCPGLGHSKSGADPLTSLKFLFTQLPFLHSPACVCAAAVIIGHPASCKEPCGEAGPAIGGL